MIIDIVHQNLAKPFTYLIPDSIHVVPGQRVLVPFGRLEKEGIVLSLTDKTELGENRIRSVIRPLEDYAAIPDELLKLAEEMAGNSHCPLAETLRLMLPAQMRGGRVHPKTEKAFRLTVPGTAADELIASARRKTKKTAVLTILKDEKIHTIHEIGENVNNPGEVLKKLHEEGIIEIIEEEIMRNPVVSYSEVKDPGYILTNGQQEALSEIIPALNHNGGCFLLHGVTGSGKTEVFMAAVRQTIRNGKSAIILVPEIALTPQMVSWFRGRFGSAAAVIHSRLSSGERYDEWRRIRKGEAKVVIGARSAVFSPVQNLGMIVIDEEHESTYLNDRHPRYDTRKVAESRCRREEAVLILASATPSILSFARARRGDYMLLEMPERVNKQPLPEVEIVDMRSELEMGNRSVLSNRLVQKLKECIHRNEQAILLMNRRGYHSFVSCRSCGYVVKCPQCDISMTYHIGQGDNLLKCHYCGYSMNTPQVCPSCGGKYIRFFGAGTQKVEEEVRKILPGISVSRMDYDTTGGKDGHGKILEKFRKGESRILIGTQMVAKGLDFPRVTLVGVVAADMALNLPDYRSRERAYQLFTQAAGRAGRGSLNGHVIFQTYKPEDPVIGFAARQDYRSFFEYEFQRRRNSLYPPFTNLARILVESPKEDIADRLIHDMDTRIHQMLESHPEWKRRILNMISEPPSVHMLRGKFRRQILMKTLVHPDADSFFRFVSDVAAEPYDKADVYLEINPTTMI